MLTSDTTDHAIARRNAVVIIARHRALLAQRTTAARFGSYIDAAAIVAIAAAFTSVAVTVIGAF